jgi:2-oxoglutarate dehydrogenase complex dehydrogenase (E1) component-like enzyme
MYGGPDRRGVRKPLVIFTPKSLLRHPKASSRIEEFTSGEFREVMGDDVAEPSGVSRVLLCSGKIYYDLLAAREERKAQEVAIIRFEQLYPFPEHELEEILAKYERADEVVWVQEEPRNMGPWQFMRGRLQTSLEASDKILRYAGRAESASPATGSHKRHLAEQAAVVEEAFSPVALPSQRAVRLVPGRKAR